MWPCTWHAKGIIPIASRPCSAVNYKKKNATASSVNSAAILFAWRELLSLVHWLNQAHDSLENRYLFHTVLFLWQLANSSVMGIGRQPSLVEHLVTYSYPQRIFQIPNCLPFHADPEMDSEKFYYNQHALIRIRKSYKIILSYHFHTSL